MSSLKASRKIQTEGRLPDSRQGVPISDLQSLVAVLQDSLPGILADQPVSLAYLFGSTAAGFTTTFSDIDIGLLVDDSLNPAGRLCLILHLNLVLSELLNISNVDVRMINDAPIIFCGRVVTDGLLVYSRDEVERVNFETLTRQRYYDYLPIHRQLQDAFFADILRRGLNG